MTTVTYNMNIPYTGNRPYADVVLSPGNPNTPTHKCLVDTGADYLQLPAGAATAIGLSLANAQQVPVSTVAGTKSLLLLSALHASIENIPVTVDVLFDPTNTAISIAGRQVLWAAFDYGFNLTDWLHT